MKTSKLGFPNFCSYYYIYIYIYKNNVYVFVCMYINTHTSVCMHVCICVNCIFAGRHMKATFLELGQTLRFLSYAQTPSETISCVNFTIKLILC